MLPRPFDSKPLVPPLKTQGIKTKLLSFLFESISWSGKGRWIEPFCGSAVVAFNLAPKRAHLSDANPVMIDFYSALQQGVVTPESVECHLEENGALLATEESGAHYYRVRERFNAERDPHDWLFLNRSCFNGVIRFNRKGEFNVPFCRKPQRFSRSLRTKIVNQVTRARDVIAAGEWTFTCRDWRDAMADAEEGDFVYLDPPYIGRHAGYFLPWADEDARALALRAHELPCGAALSMWRRNRFRENAHLEECWSDWRMKTRSHYYHVGAGESLRHAMEEALVLNRHAVSRTGASGNRAFIADRSAEA